MAGPTDEFEQKAFDNGKNLVAGVDEVGRGCLAGPVVAAAVIFRPNEFPLGLNDSKKLSAQKREKFDIEIRNCALAYAIGVGQVEEIDEINILNAAKNAMLRAISDLSKSPDYLLIDGNQKLKTTIPQETIVKGDSKSVSIAAASILAKVFRDNMMVAFDKKYPGYDLASNKGYGSVSHRLGLMKQGQTIIHRKSFSWTPVELN